MIINGKCKETGQIVLGVPTIYRRKLIRKQAYFFFFFSVQRGKLRDESVRSSSLCEIRSQNIMIRLGNKILSHERFIVFVS
jgi:hypothetical protein